MHPFYTFDSHNLSYGIFLAELNIQFSQFSTTKARMRLNSPILAVTSTAPSE
jgi:hypothetical protein